VTSVIIAAGCGPVLAMLATKVPGACTIITWSLRSVALHGLYEGAVEVYKGNYATGALTMIGSAFAVYGAFKTSFCFVAGTQVVLCLNPAFGTLVVDVARRPAPRTMPRWPRPTGT
jgi:hypothetical protein